MNGVIYFAMTAGDRFIVKIGFSRQDPRKRIKQLQTACPFVLELAASVVGDEALERRLHQTFAPCRMSGEWFVGDHKLRDFIYYIMGHGDGERRITSAELRGAIHDCVVKGLQHPDNPTPKDVYDASADASIWGSL